MAKVTKLTENQNKIINELKKEFEQINATIKPPISSGLINVAGIKNDIILKDKFIAECNAENTAYARMVDKKVREDAEKLRGDLNELGLDVSYRNDGLCTSIFSIVKKGDFDALIKIDYERNTYLEKSFLYCNMYINKTYLINFKYGGNSWECFTCKTIEELVAYEQFQKRLRNVYEQVNKL